MKKKLFSLGMVLSLISSIALASGVPTSLNTDTLILGKKAAGDKKVIFQNNAGSSNPLLKWNNSTSKIQFSNDGSFFSDLGSGSGGGGTNYITNSDFENGTTGWATYANAAQATPTTGTGGSPTITFTASTSSPMVGLKSGLLTKGASNLQGQGVSSDFTIAPGDQAAVLNVSFDYNASSGMVVGSSSDISVWVYDKTNSVLIPVTPYQLQGNGANNWKYAGTFQSNNNSTSYRLIIHNATTNATAWTLKLDSVVLGPQIQLYGSPVLDWTAYTPTFGAGLGTVTSPGFFYRRNGDSLDVLGAFTTGTVSSSAASISLPSGLSIDTSKISDKTVIGGAGQTNGSTKNFFALYNSGSQTTVGFGDGGNTNNQLSVITGSDFQNTTAVSISFKVPIAGWSSTLLMSNDTDTRVVAARYYTNATTAGIGVANLPVDTKEIDTHAAFNTSTETYTIPVSGKYSVNAWMSFQGTATNSTTLMNVKAFLKKNGTIFSMGMFSGLSSSTNNNQFVNVSGIIDCVAGDTILPTVDGTPGTSGSSVSLANNGAAHTAVFEISRLTGPSAIAASEKVFLQYVNNGGQAQTADVTDMTWSTKVVDSHGAWNGTQFTAPRSGFYIFHAGWNIASGVNTNLRLWVNGSVVIATNTTTTADTQHASFFTRYLNAGDVASMRITNNVTLSASAIIHWLSIFSQ